MGGLTEIEINELIMDFLRERTTWSEFKLERAAEELMDELWEYFKEDD